MRIWKQYASWVWTRGIRRLTSPPDRRGSHNDTNYRLQRRIRHIQEPQFQRLGKSTFLPITHSHHLTPHPPGPRRPNLHPPLLALLLRQHGCGNLRHRQHRHRPPDHRLGRTARHAQRRRTARRRAARLPPRRRPGTRPRPGPDPHRRPRHFPRRLRRSPPRRRESTDREITQLFVLIGLLAVEATAIVLTVELMARGRLRPRSS